MVLNTSLLLPPTNLFGAFVLEVEPNILLNVTSTLSDINGPRRLKPMFANTNDYGKWT
jgi:hypothetical protein